VRAAGSREAPGVYVDGAKLASVGLRIRRGASYHGFALNVSLDLEPFERINVCGHRGLAVTRLADLSPRIAGLDAAGAMNAVASGLTPHLLRYLKFAADYSAINTDLQAVSSR
jgi:lipoyl(octanoyl) transferase